MQHKWGFRLESWTKTGNHTLFEDKMSATAEKTEARHHVWLVLPWLNNSKHAAWKCVAAAVNSSKFTTHTFSPQYNQYNQQENHWSFQWQSKVLDVDFRSKLIVKSRECFLTVRKRCVKCVWCAGVFVEGSGVHSVETRGGAATESILSQLERQQGSSSHIKADSVYPADKALW